MIGLTHDSDSQRGSTRGNRECRRATIFAILPVFALVMLVLNDRAVAADDTDPSAEVLVLRRCPIDYERSATLGSNQYGVIQECLVVPGERVKAGKVLGRIRDDDLRAELKLRELEAKSDVEIRLSEAKSSQAMIRLRTTQSLVKRNAASVEDFNLHKMEAEAAGIAVEQAKQNHELAKIRLQQAQVQLQAREFVSPYDGVVVAILKRLGEPVAPNEPVFKVVDTERLQITGQADITDSWRLQVGQSVRVIPDISGADLPVEREVFTGRIVFIDTHIDPTNQTCKVLVNVDNRGGLLRAGLETRLEIDPRAIAVEKRPTPTPLTNGPVPPALRSSTTNLTGGVH
ncbi:efflux RND transporter periplasmic adaptor subunit [Singulisphaera sp. Ch08]|uniref:Efflux RND transporter periplasmic adaptor subunit n=1 Tax=Singulisphaera sp. Ch08 TaxID=3120278 RepID=A0AAU7C6V4_9BACT